MGIAKYYEDIQEEIEERMRASGRNYYDSTSDYPRKNFLQRLTIVRSYL